MPAVAASVCLPRHSDRMSSGEVEELYQRSITGDASVYTEDYASTLDSGTLRALHGSGMTYAFYDVSITPNGRSFEECIRSVTLWYEAVARNRDTVLRADI